MILHDIIYFKKSLPFYPSDHQVIYIEDKYNETINSFIRDNYESICSAFAEFGHEFCYLPILTEKLCSDAFIKYFTPYQSGIAQVASFSNDYLNPYAKGGTDLSPAFIIKYNQKSNHNYWAFKTIRLSSKGTDMSLQVASIIKTLKEEYEEELKGIRSCSTDFLDCYEGDEYADRKFPTEVEKLMDDVREKIEKLRQHGVSEMILNTLLCPTTQISRLKITSSHRILLPDYGNLEIKMTPLVKAVFILFLRHPEGIIFKTLPDYRSELFNIYSRLSGRESNEQIRQSIMDVTNPCKNSINEKCARIREAFIKEFDDRLAQYYYITGNRGTAKKICLPRHLVFWESDEKNNESV